MREPAPPRAPGTEWISRPPAAASAASAAPRRPAGGLEGPRIPIAHADAPQPSNTNAGACKAPLDRSDTAAPETLRPLKRAFARALTAVRGESGPHLPLLAGAIVLMAGATLPTDLEIRLPGGAPQAAIALHAAHAAWPLLRAAVVLPIALTVPGAACELALFGKQVRSDRTLPPALWMLLSMALYPFLALVLHACGIALSRHSIALGMGTLILALVAIGMARRSAGTSAMPQGAPREHRPGTLAESHAPPAEAIGVADRHDPPGTGGAAHETPQIRTSTPPLPLSRGAALRAASATAAFLLVVFGGSALLPADAPSHYTLLTLDSATARARGPLQADTTLAVRVHIENWTGGRRIYRLLPDIDGRWRWPIRPVPLGTGSSWDGTLTGAVPLDGALHRLRIALRASTGEQVATLILWVQSRPPSGSARASDAAGPPHPIGDAVCTCAATDDGPPEAKEDTAAPQRSGAVADSPAVAGNGDMPEHWRRSPAGETATPVMGR